MALGGLHDVECPDHVRFDIGPGVLERVPDTGLGREVDDHVGPKLVSDRLHQLAVLEHTLGEAVVRVALQDRVPLPLEVNVVVVGHPVVAVDDRALIQQQPSEVEPDEAGGPCDEVPCHGRWPVFCRCLWPKAASVFLLAIR